MSNLTITIPLSKQSTNPIKYETIISAEDSDLAAVNWVIIAARYAARSNDKTYLHRIIMGRKLGRELSPKEYVDHIDGNGLNNIRDNLRLATQTQNMQNSKKRGHNKSGYKGVYERKNRKIQKWFSVIVVNGRQIWLGTYATRELAYEAYKQAAIKYHQEYANFGDTE